jgi:8-oxo-dGTP pyrophosphatase MutT (NUDIX family)
VAAGLREVSEELGITLDHRDVLGRLDDYVTESGYIIAPVVCWAPASCRPQPNTAEVASAHLVPFADLLDRPTFVTDAVSGRLGIRMPMMGYLIEVPTGSFVPLR